MRTVLSFLAAVCLRSLRAGDAVQPRSSSTRMVGPIALYPTPDCAHPSRVDAPPTSRRGAVPGFKRDPSQVDAQSWDQSVKAWPLSRRAQVDERQPRLDAGPGRRVRDAAGRRHEVDPADAVQGRGAGTLVNTPQQQVDDEGTTSGSFPRSLTRSTCRSTTPTCLRRPEGDTGPFLSFDAGYPVGPWLGFECDWDDYGSGSAVASRLAYRRDWRRGRGAAAGIQFRRRHDLVRITTTPGKCPRPQVIAGARGPAGAVRGGAPGASCEAGPRPPRSGSVTITIPSRITGYAETAPRRGRPRRRARLWRLQRGTQVRDNSVRGHTSRQAPSRGPPRPGPRRRGRAGQSESRHRKDRTESRPHAP